MKQWRLLSVVFIIGLLGWGCSKKEESTEKILRIPVAAEVKGFDPIDAGDKYASDEIGKVYEGLLQYHYLKRPYTLIPNLAEAMPEVSADGLSYTFKVRPGVLFQDDESFPGGKGRELVAEDFVYSIKRLADPKQQSTGWWLYDGKLKGLNEWRDRNAQKSASDYSEVVDGVMATDKYTVRFVLSRPFPQFLYALAMPYSFVTAKEVVDHYGKEFINHPVGTGPFKMVSKFSVQSRKIEYIKNPTFREKFYPSEGTDEDKTKGLLASAGKRIPLVDKIEVSIQPEEQTRWLNFQKGNLDHISIPKDNFASAVTPSKDLTPEMKEKGMNLDISPSLDVTYIAFQHDMPLFKNKKLRQAMSMAVDKEKENELFYNNTGIPAQSIVPPGIAGYMPSYQNPNRGLQLELAKKTLAEAGYPEGKGLPEIVFDHVGTSPTSRQMAEFFAKNMAEIGINIKLNSGSWPELTDRVRKRTTMMYGMAWGADYPDAENFLQLLYGPNESPGANGSNYKNPEFDELFKKASLMQDSPERTALYEKLNRIAAEEVPLIYGVHRTGFTIVQAWLQNFKATEFEWERAQYLDLDLAKKSELSNKF